MNLRIGLSTLAVSFAFAWFAVGCRNEPDATQLPSPQAEPNPSAQPSQQQKVESPTPKEPGNKIEDVLLFAPMPYPRGNWEPQGLKFNDVWVKSSDGTRIHGWYCPVKNPRAYVLYAHGNAGNISHRANVLARLQSMRIAILAFDYRGYGRSEGLPTKHGVIEDAAAARTHFANLVGVEPAQIVLMGRSLGGAVVAQLASKAPAKGLIIESSFSSLRDIADHHYPLISSVVDPAKLNSVTAMSKYKGPLLQSHGDADRLIPIKMGKKLFDSARGPKKFVTIPRGGHNSPQSSEYYRTLNQFLDSL